MCLLYRELVPGKAGQRRAALISLLSSCRFFLFPWVTFLTPAAFNLEAPIPSHGLMSHITSLSKGCQHSLNYEDVTSLCREQPACLFNEAGLIWYLAFSIPIPFHLDPTPSKCCRGIWGSPPAVSPARPHTHWPRAEPCRQLMTANSHRPWLSTFLIGRRNSSSKETMSSLLTLHS